MTLWRKAAPAGGGAPPVTQERARTTVQELHIAPPELKTLKATVVASFLEQEKAYRIAMHAAGRSPLQLFSLIKPELLSLMKTFVRMELGAEEAAKLPEWEEFAEEAVSGETGSRETDSAESDSDSDDSDEDSDQPAKPDIIMWNALVRRALAHAAKGSTADGNPTTTYSHIAEQVSAELRWPVTEMSCKDALNQLLQSLHNVERRLGCKLTLRGHCDDDKRFIKLITDAVRPNKFRELIADKVARHKKVNLDEWIDIVLGLSDYYTGMQLQYKASELKRKPGHTPTQDKAAAKRANATQGGKASGAKDGEVDKDLAAEAPVKKQRRLEDFERKSRSVPNHPPSKPCRLCGGDCWSWACKNFEKVKEERRLKQVAKAAKAGDKLQRRLDKLKAKAAEAIDMANKNRAGVDGTL
jgi:hypothetical protein